MELTLDRIKALAQRLADAEEVLNREITRFGPTAYRVARKSSKVPCNVFRTPTGMACSCEDWFYNKESHGGYCKHVIAILQIEEDPKLMDNMEAKIKEMY